MDFRTKKFLTHRRQLLSYTQYSYPVKLNTAISTLIHHLPVINHSLTHTPQHRSSRLPSVSNLKQKRQPTQAMAAMDQSYWVPWPQLISVWSWITNHTLLPSVTNFSYCITLTAI